MTRHNPEPSLVSVQDEDEAMQRRDKLSAEGSYGALADGDNSWPMINASRTITEAEPSSLMQPGMRGGDADFATMMTIQFSTPFLGPAGESRPLVA